MNVTFPANIAAYITELKSVVTYDIYETLFSDLIITDETYDNMNKQSVDINPIFEKLQVLEYYDHNNVLIN